MRALILLNSSQSHIHRSSTLPGEGISHALPMYNSLYTTPSPCSGGRMIQKDDPSLCSEIFTLILETWTSPSPLNSGIKGSHRILRACLCLIKGSHLLLFEVTSHLQRMQLVLMFRESRIKMLMVHERRCFSVVAEWMMTRTAGC